MSYSNFKFLEKKNEYLFYGEVKSDELVNFKIFDLKNKSIVGNIYRGRIRERIPDLNSYFVDIGLEKKGFFQVNEKDFDNYSENDELIFQVVSDFIGDKGPKLTDKYELKGRHFILTPFDKNIKISKKIKSQEKRDKLKGIIYKTLPNNIGIVVRTSAEDINDEDITKEIKHLLSIEKRLIKEKNFSPTPKLLLENNHIESLLFQNTELPIFVNNRELFNKINEFGKFDIELDLGFKIKETKYFKYVNSLFNREVILENGIELIFDKTEAFHVIDVNSHKYLTSNTDIDLSTVNYKVIKDLVKQIDFRNIYGIILVDLLSMSTKEHKKDFLSELFLESKKYSNPINIIGITKLGILELTKNKNVSNESIENLTIDIFD